MLGLPVFDNIGLAVDEVVEVLLCMTCRSLAVFVVFDGDVVDEVGCLWSWMKLNSGGSTEIVCEWTSNLVFGEVCVKLPLYVRKEKVFVGQESDN